MCSCCSCQSRISSRLALSYSFIEAERGIRYFGTSRQHHGGPLASHSYCLSLLRQTTNSRQPNNRRHYSSCRFHLTIVLTLCTGFYFNRIKKLAGQQPGLVAPQGYAKDHKLRRNGDGTCLWRPTAKMACSRRLVSSYLFIYFFPPLFLLLFNRQLLLVDIPH